MKYLPIPKPVEAMQWLGPDDPEHVEAFEAWVVDCDKQAAIVHEPKGSVVILGVDATLVYVGDFVVWDRDEVRCFAHDEFYTRYTPAQEGE